MTDNIVRAIRTVVELGSYSFDAYEMPDGEKRVGFAGASNVLGYEKNWIGELDKKGKKTARSYAEYGLHRVSKKD